MLVFVEWSRIRRDVVVGERHVLGVEEPAAPSGQGLSAQHVFGIDKRHARSVRSRAQCYSRTRSRQPHVFPPPAAITPTSGGLAIWRSPACPHIWVAPSCRKP